MVSKGSSDKTPVTASDMHLFHDSLAKLYRWTDPHNIFGILRIEGAEIRHSNFLAWLLDPKGTHGFGTFFIDSFLKEVQKKRDIGYVPGSNDLSDAKVYRELYSMDIVVKLESCKIVLVVENKVHALESKDQLRTYQDMIEGSFMSLGFVPVYVFLTVAGDLPSNDEWVDLPYSSIYPHIQALLDMESDDRTRIYLEDYIRTIGVEMFMDEELQKVCSELYKNHARELKLLNDFSIEMFNRRTGAIQHVLDEMPDIEYKMNGRDFIITTSSIREVNTKLSGDPFGPVFILFINKAPEANYSTICFIIGPGDSEIRKMCYNHLINYSLCKPKRAYTPQYSRIYSEYVSFDAGSDGLEEWIDKTVKMITDFLEKHASGFGEFY